MDKAAYMQGYDKLRGSDALYKGIAERLRTSRPQTSEYDLHDFIDASFKDYMWNWHNEQICNLVDAWLRGETKRFLMIFAPPRHGKTEIVSKRLPAYIFGKTPDKGIMSCSYGATLATRNNLSVQQILETAKYQEIFPRTKLPLRGTRQKRTSNFFEIRGRAGHLISSGIKGSIVGLGMHYGIIDDPIKNRQDANSALIRERCWEFYTASFRTRLTPDGKILIIMTRWHEDDLCGRLLETEPENWDWVNLPALYDDEIAKSLPPFVIDDRDEKNEPLWPQRYTFDELSSIAETLGVLEFSSQYQGNPYTDAGAILKPGYWNRYAAQDLPELMKRFVKIVQTWDTAFEEGQENDYTVGQTWGITENGYYLLHAVRDKLNYPDLRPLMVNSAQQWKPSEIYIEYKASGIPVVQDLLLNTTLPIIPITPQCSKLQRVHGCSGTVSAGKCWLPLNNPYVALFVEQCRRFPNVTNDDDVDAFTQMLLVNMYSDKPTDNGFLKVGR